MTEKKNTDKVNPHFFSGFVQADGCFHIGMHKDNTAKHKIRLKPTFYVYQLNAPCKQISPLLRMGRDLLQTGHYVADKKNNCSLLCVNTLKDLNKSVLPHFEKYPLLSRKREDYLYFKEIVEKMSKKLHYDAEIFTFLVEKAFSMNNKGKYRKKHISNNVVFFSNTPLLKEGIEGIPKQTVVRDLLRTSPFLRFVTPCNDESVYINPKKVDLLLGETLSEQKRYNPQFVSGLFQGDGVFGFSFRTRKNRNNKKVPKVSPFFTLGQENESIDLLEGVQRFFKKGTLYKVSSNFSRWAVNDLSSLKENVLPHFIKNPLIGVKGEHLCIFMECIDILLSTQLCKKVGVKKVIELCYDLNMGGKQSFSRRIPKEEYLRAIAS